MKAAARSFLLLGALLLAAAPARAETTFQAYVGKSFTSNSDVRLRQPAAGTDLTFQDVSFDDESFVAPYYYGARVSHWLKRKPWLGVSFDFFHYKVFAETEKTVRVTGRRGGAPVNAREPMRDTLQRFSISHGINYFTLNVMARRHWMKSGRYPNGRLQPYVGVGLGALLLHPESRSGGVFFEQYEWNGLGGQVFAGANYLLTPRLAFFGEWKYTGRDVNVAVVGGSADVNLSTHSLVFGLSYQLLK